MRGRVQSTAVTVARTIRAGAAAFPTCPDGPHGERFPGISPFGVPLNQSQLCSRDGSCVVRQEIASYVFPRQQNHRPDVPRWSRSLRDDSAELAGVPAGAGNLLRRRELAAVAGTRPGPHRGPDPCRAGHPASTGARSVLPRRNLVAYAFSRWNLVAYAFPRRNLVAYAFARRNLVAYAFPRWNLGAYPSRDSKVTARPPATESFTPRRQRRTRGRPSRCGKPLPSPRARNRRGNSPGGHIVLAGRGPTPSPGPAPEWHPCRAGHPASTGARSVHAGQGASGRPEAQCPGPTLHVRPRRRLPRPDAGSPAPTPAPPPPTPGWHPCRAGHPASTRARSVHTGQRASRRPEAQCPGPTLHLRPDAVSPTGPFTRRPESPDAPIHPAAHSAPIDPAARFARRPDSPGGR